MDLVPSTRPILSPLAAPSMTPESHTPSLHDALPISWDPIPDDGYTAAKKAGVLSESDLERVADVMKSIKPMPAVLDRKSTRLNSSHLVTSYAVSCLKKKRSTRAGRTQASAIDT